MKDTHVLIIVEHFLTKEGKGYFEDWIDEVRRVIDSYNGFQSLQRIFDPQNPDRTLLYLTFKRFNQLKVWSTSDDHEEVLGLLKPYQKKKQKSQLYTTTKHG